MSIPFLLDEKPTTPSRNLLIGMLLPTSHWVTSVS
jgi:hypothetical protein